MIKNILITSSLRKPVGALHLANVARALGHNVTIANPNDNEILREFFDIVIPRISPQNYKETVNIFPIIIHNSPAAVWSTNPAFVEASFHKWKTYKALQKAGLPTPMTWVVATEEQLELLIDKLPLITKPLIGNRGEGVAVIKTRDDLGLCVGEIKNRIFQEFIDDKETIDIRAFVVGDKVVAAIQKEPKKGTNVANLALGATAKPIILDPADVKLAVDAARVFGAHVAGVDLIKSNTETKILEINISPGIKIEEITKIPVTELWLLHLIKLADQAIGEIK